MPGNRKLPPICSTCAKRATCTKVCPIIDDLANNYQPLREKLLTYDGDRKHIRDYKAVLLEKQKEKRILRKLTIHHIRKVEDPRARLVFAARYAGLSMTQLASITGIPRTMLYRILEEYQRG